MCVCVLLTDDRREPVVGRDLHVCGDGASNVYSGSENSALDSGARSQCMTASLCGLCSSVKGRFDIFFLSVGPSFKPVLCPGNTHKGVFCWSWQNPAM